MRLPILQLRAFLHATRMWRSTNMLVLLLFGLCFAQPANAQVPDTPAGRQFSGWIRALNSGDRATMQQFIDRSMPGQPVERGLAVRNQTGGLDVKKVEESSATRIVVLAQERGPAKQFVRITLDVTTAAPDRIDGIAMQPAQPPAEFAPAKLSASELDAARKAAPFRQFSAWLEAFNSADRNRISQFLTTNFPSRDVAGELSFRARTTGFDFRVIEQASPTTVMGLVQAREGDNFARFVVEVEPTEPRRITRLNLPVVPRPAEFPVARLSEAELITALRSKLEKDAAADRFSGTALVSKISSGTGRVLFSEAYGLADRQNKVANTLNTRFRLGSMNKMFTATSILQLVQAGKIKLTDPVGKYIKDYPNQDIANKVTIHHLLTHTGGTGDIFGPQYAARRLELRTLDDYVKLYGARAPEFEPGSRWAYSNYGMLLLGVVIERVSGQSYYDYVDQHIYKPAGMTRSGSEPENEVVPNRSTGYMRGQGAGEWTRNTNTLPWRGTAAGGGYSTVGDLLKFAAALMGHKLLNAENTALLIAGKADTSGGRKYAYGSENGGSTAG